MFQFRLQQEPQSKENIMLGPSVLWRLAVQVPDELA